MLPVSYMGCLVQFIALKQQVNLYLHDVIVQPCKVKSENSAGLHPNALLKHHLARIHLL